MEKKHLTAFVVKLACIEKISNVFADEDEAEEFILMLGDVIEDILFAAQLANRNQDNEDFLNMLCMKQLILLGIFCQKNIESIKELINSVEYREIKYDKTVEIEYDKELEFLL